MKIYQRIITWTLVAALMGFLGFNYINSRKLKEPPMARYFNFSKMPQIDISSDKVSISNSLEHLIERLSNNRWSNVSDLNKFRCEVLKVAEELGYSKQKIEVLEPSELIRFSTEIVGKRLTYHYVDQDPVFIKENGAFLPLDKYFYLGLGDCDKYADLTIEIYNFLKSMNSNPKNKNVYLTREFCGEPLFPHAWVSVVVGISPNEIYCTHIDPTYADNGRELEATREHINPDFFEFKFLQELRTYKGYIKSNQLIDDLLVKETHTQRIAELMAGKARNLEGLENNLEAAIAYEKAAYLTDYDRLRSLWLRNACQAYFYEGKDDKVIEIANYAKDKVEDAFYTSIFDIAIKSTKRLCDYYNAQQHLNEVLTEIMSR